MNQADQELITKLQEDAERYAADAANEEAEGNTITAAMYRKYERRTQALIEKMKVELGKGGGASEN